jgi:hypothetical protein
MPSRTPRSTVAVITGAAAILALAVSPIGDQGFGFPAIVLLGPVITGAVAACRHRAWQPVAAAWGLSGVLMLVTDWAINNEDQIFHVVLAVLMMALTALGAAIGRRLRTGAVAVSRG